MPDGKLTRKQQLFVHEYLVDLNATQAAIRCGYSDKSAYNQGSRMMSNDEVRRAIDTAMRDKIRRADVTADDVLRLITRAAFARLTDFVDWSQTDDGEHLGLRVKSPDEIGADADLLSEITEEVRDYPSGREVTRKVKLVNKEQMIRLLADHFGLTEKKLKLEAGASLADVLTRAWSDGGSTDGRQGS